MSSACEPRRIAFCITELDPGGAEKMLVELVTRLDRSDWAPHVYCLAPTGPLAERLLQADIPVTSLNVRSPLQWGAVFRFARLLQSFQPVLLQTFLFHANIAGRIAGRLARVPKIVSGIRVAEKDSPWRLWLDRRTNRLVDCNVCVSHAVAEFSERVARLPGNKCAVIPNGIDTDRLKSIGTADLSEFGIPPSGKTALFVGRLAPQKDPFQLLYVADLLLPKHRDLHFLIVGDGPLGEAMKERVGQTGWQSRVHFAGWRPDVASLMKASYCLTLTSLWEGMPNVVLEAMACRLPVVATDVEGVSELIRDGVNGFVAPPRNAEAFGQALDRLLQDSVKAETMGEKSQESVNKDFTIFAMVSKYVRLFENLLSGSHCDDLRSLPEKI